MATTGHWAELRERILDTPESRERYERKRRAIVQTREILMQIDAARQRRGLSKAELARRIGSDPSVVRRLFSSRASNPTLRVILDLLSALDLDVELRPATTSSPPPPTPEQPRAEPPREVAA